MEIEIRHLSKDYITVSVVADNAIIDLGSFDAREAVELTDSLIGTVNELLDFTGRTIDKINDKQDIY